MIKYGKTWISMYSLEHQQYLKKLKKHKFLILCFQLLIICSFLIFWQILADLEKINTFIFSSPKAIIDTLIKLHNTNNLYQHIWITVYETFISFGIGTILGFVIATILWWNKTLYQIFDPYLTILNSLPKVALGPIIIIWAGAGMKSIILMALLISVIITIMNVYQGFTEVDPVKIKLMQSFKANRYQIYTKLIIPSSVTNLISTLKVNISLTLIGLLPPVGENFIV